MAPRHPRIVKSIPVEQDWDMEANRETTVEQEQSRDKSSTTSGKLELESTEETPDAAMKRDRGRPRGSKNKKKARRPPKKAKTNDDRHVDDKPAAEEEPAVLENKPAARPAIPLESDFETVNYPLIEADDDRRYSLIWFLPGKARCPFPLKNNHDITGIP
ncbi:hypothetical protein BDV26DRAFT_296930 [Aspergillus bertholletiae]|uniref:Uncharacterized protein n=1 Tax=Aspergillus bertholletiae TaxID=1226010 RepID=A0A5N7AUA3_9EURO|nr:hypothetical protein BDV26DRAFT_296930 [Aspergillus bertholletiae]